MIPETAKRLDLDLVNPVDATVALILDDVRDRRGWRQEWDQFDQEVQREIVAKWRTILKASPLVKASES